MKWEQVMEKRRQRQERSPMMVTGLSSLLAVFAVLCLTIFAVLSVSTVRADMRLAEEMTEAALSFYRAESQAEEVLAHLRQGTDSEKIFELTGIRVEGENREFSWTCPVSAAQELRAEVSLAAGAGRGMDYEILKWQLVSTADWQADDSLHVWEGPAEEEN